MSPEHSVGVGVACAQGTRTGTKKLGEDTTHPQMVRTGCRKCAAGSLPPVQTHPEVSALSRPHAQLGLRGTQLPFGTQGALLPLDRTTSRGFGSGFWPEGPIETDPETRVRVHVYWMVIPGTSGEGAGGDSGKGIKGVLSSTLLPAIPCAIGLGQREPVTCWRLVSVLGRAVAVGGWGEEGCCCVSTLPSATPPIAGHAPLSNSRIPAVWSLHSRENPQPRSHVLCLLSSHQISSDSSLSPRPAPRLRLSLGTPPGAQSPRFRWWRGRDKGGSKIPSSRWCWRTGDEGQRPDHRGSGVEGGRSLPGPPPRPHPLAPPLNVIALGERGPASVPGGMTNRASGSPALEFSWRGGRWGTGPPPQEAVEGPGGWTGAGPGGHPRLLRGLLSRESHTNLRAQTDFWNLPRLKISSSVVWGLSASEPVAGGDLRQLLGGPTPDH